MFKKLGFLAFLVLVSSFIPLKIPRLTYPLVISKIPTAVPEVKSAVTEGVPEMTEILSPDQEHRIKAGRKLVERVGIEEALEILEHSPLPHTGEGHLVVHQIGFYAYQKFGMQGILKCKDYFLFACYHGVIIEAATNQGIPAIAKMTDICKASSTRYFQCVHAAGHAILAMYSYDLAQSLKTCDQLYENEIQFPDALSSCHNGAFMENLFGVHDWGKDKTPKRAWLKDDDPYFPCTYFDEKYQKGCWLNQAARIYQMYQGNIPKTAHACEIIGNRTHSEWCFDNLARQIHPLSNGDPAKSFELCQQVGSYWEQGCLIVNAQAFYSVGGRLDGINICSKLVDQARQVCYAKILSQIISDTIPPQEKKNLCDRLDPQYKKQCITQVEIQT